MYVTAHVFCNYNLAIILIFAVLARSAKVAERAIYFTLRNFFLFFLFYSSFLMISWRQIISRSAGPIFAIFTSNESFLAIDDRSGPLFSISQGTLQKMANSAGLTMWQMHGPQASGGPPEVEKFFFSPSVYK